MQAALISNYNLDNLRGFLQSREMFDEIEVAQLSAWMPALQDPALSADLGIVWVSPDQALPAFKAFIDGGRIDDARLFQEVADFLELVERAADRFHQFYLFEFALPRLGAYDDPVRDWLDELNARLVSRLRGNGHIRLFRFRPLVSGIGEGNAVSTRSWLMSKMPYSLRLLQAIGTTLLRQFRQRLEGSRKLIILDLDNTLWGGILGDDGAEGLRLGGHDAIGEAYVELQRELKRLKNRGILLAVSSKNDRQNAIDTIDAHPEMVLRSEDFCVMQIDWTDKAEHVASILRSVNVGPQSAVFLDDNPSERGRVREAHPEVLVPDMPESPLLYLEVLHSLDCFDFSSLTDEDMSRTEMIRQDHDRDASQSGFASLGDWLASLEVEVAIEPLREQNLPRVSQLLNKTNQMNLRTRRMEESDWLRWCGEDGNEMYAFRVSDRFGDSGLTGVLGLSARDDEVYVEDFVLSCRVFGKQIEEVMLAQASALAGSRRLIFDYIETARNGPCRRFLDKGHLERKGSRYVRNSGQPFPFPDHVSVVRE